MSIPFPQVGMEFVYGFFHYGMGVLCDIHFNAAVSGVDNIPRQGGFIVAVNHASLLDPPIVGSFVPRQICAFARRTLWKGGLSSWWLDAVGVIPVDREAGSDVTAIRRVIRTKPSLYYEAGDRTGRLPETLELDFGKFRESYNAATVAAPTAKAVEPSRPAQAAAKQ